MRKSSAELKQLAKKSLSGKYSIPVGTYFIYLFISVMISFVIQTFIFPNTTYSRILYTIVSLIVSLLQSVFALGLTKLWIDIARDKPMELGDITYGFSHHPDKIIVSTFLITIITMIWMLPALILSLIYWFVLDSLIVFILFIVTLILGIIISVIYALRYSLVYYILIDHPDINSIDALKESKRLTKGHLGRLFYLEISFFGWIILGLLSCSIGFMWIVPYLGVTVSYFYIDIIGELEDNKQSEDYFM